MAMPLAELNKQFRFYSLYPYGPYLLEYHAATLVALQKAAAGVKSTTAENMPFYGPDRYNKPEDGDEAEKKHAETVSKGLKAALAPLRNQKP